MTNKMSIVECEDLAKDEGFNTSTFDIVGPGTRKKAKWVDAYMGFFEIEGHKGVMMTSDAKHAFRTMGLHCENFKCSPK